MYVHTHNTLNSFMSPFVCKQQKAEQQNHFIVNVTRSSKKALTIGR